MIKDRNGEPEGGEWESIKILLEGDRDSNELNTTFQRTSSTQLPKCATGPRSQHTTFRTKTHEHTQKKLALLAACATPVRPMACAAQTGDTGQTGGQSR
jgi:hypothetical protein